ncbi:MAG: DUF3108 domain-containing protein [Balneolaceae bacterium]|nr:DUF3108 domain-containing protein [Balneolaceae bacterium]
MRFYILLLFLMISSSGFGQSPDADTASVSPGMDQLFSVKEEFRYEVKYGFFKLGWINVTLLSDTLYQGRMLKHLYTEIESNAGIPFIGKEVDQYHSLFYVNQAGLPQTVLFWKDNIDEQEYNEIQYTFDRQADSVYYKEEDGSQDTLSLEDPATAGHIIFYFSRLFAGSDESFKLPVYVTKKKGYIYADNSLETEKRNYAAFDETISAYKLEGTTENIEGPFGFSGDFRAWYLTDDLRVPLEARVKVFLGNVIVKIIEYRRTEL